MSHIGHTQHHARIVEAASDAPKPANFVVRSSSSLLDAARLAAGLRAGFGGRYNTLAVCAAAPATAATTIAAAAATPTTTTTTTAAATATATRSHKVCSHCGSLVEVDVGRQHHDICSAISGGGIILELATTCSTGAHTNPAHFSVGVRHISSGA
jgi:hypothetical protein